jgi:hypothetical protein
MKKLIVFLLLLCSLPVSAAISGAPFSPESDARFNCLESGWCPKGSNPHFGIFEDKVTLKGMTAGAHNTRIVLPPKTIIKQAIIKVVTQVSAGGVSTALMCDNANDILSALDGNLVGAATYSGVETGTAANMHYSSAGCTVVLTTGAGTVTAGVWDVILETVPAL